MDIDYSSVKSITKALRKGTVSEQDLISIYNKKRKAVMRQIQRIQKSETPFTTGNIPRPPTIREISGAFGVDKRALIRELAEIGTLQASKRYSIPGRADTKRKTLETLRKRGMDIADSEFNKWVRFITWFKQSAYSALYDSNSEVVMDVFEEGNSSAQWNRLFKEYSEYE